jgi:prepilin-type N-terminal cleavage/methylation domain-containing protein
MKRLRHHHSNFGQCRNGYTLLELVVAMTVLGIALTGLFPLMIMQSRTVESLELQYTSQGDGNTPVFRSQLTSTVNAIGRANYGSAVNPWYLVPSADPWARKLGAAAGVSNSKPAAPTEVIADNSGACTFTGTWTVGTSSSAFGGDYRSHAVQATPTDTATWTFGSVTQGLYYVVATWPAATSLATDAKYEVYQGTTLKATISPVDQTVTPNSAACNGWRLLTTQAFTDSGAPTLPLTISVKLYASATGTVAADAVQVIPAAQVLSVDKSFNSEQVTVRVKLGGS